MRKLILPMLLTAAIYAWADAPALVIHKTNGEETTIALSDIQKINHQDANTVIQKKATEALTVPMTDIERMTFTNISTAVEDLNNMSSTTNAARKVIINGNVYILKNGVYYTLLGERSVVL